MLEPQRIFQESHEPGDFVDPFKIIASLLLAPMFMGIALSAKSADLEIEVRGIKARTGQVHAALFDNAEDFAIDLTFRATVGKDGEVKIGVFTKDNSLPRAPAGLAAAPANAATVRLHITDIAPGTYAVALYHDVNNDGKVDTNFEGKPLEPWGMSNNPKYAGRKLTFDDAKFELPAEGLRLVIDLQQ
jgi:uncharacterized protein (DUF2141 family)